MLSPNTASQLGIGIQSEDDAFQPKSEENTFAPHLHLDAGSRWMRCLVKLNYRDFLVNSIRMKVETDNFISMSILGFKQKQ